MSDHSTITRIKSPESNLPHTRVCRDWRACVSPGRDWRNHRPTTPRPRICRTDDWRMMMSKMMIKMMMMMMISSLTALGGGRRARGVVVLV